MRQYRGNSFAGYRFCAVLLAVGLGIECAPALGHGKYPAHNVRGIECRVLDADAGPFKGQRQVRAYPPGVMKSWYDVDYRRAELVHWKPVLYRFDERARQWVSYDARAGWIPAATSSYGFFDKGWYSKSTGGQLKFFPFSPTHPGTYTVLNRLQWTATNIVHEEWAPNRCQI